MSIIIHLYPGMSGHGYVSIDAYMVGAAPSISDVLPRSKATRPFHSAEVYLYYRQGLISMFTYLMLFSNHI